MELNYSGIIGLECALGYHGACTFMSREFPIYIIEGNGYYEGTPTIVGVGSMPDESELTSINGVVMTTPERSIIDMIRIKPDSEFLSQAIVHYEDTPVMGRVIDMARHYRLEKELRSQMKKAASIYDENFYGGVITGQKYVDDLQRIKPIVFNIYDHRNEPGDLLRLIPDQYIDSSIVDIKDRAINAALAFISSNKESSNVSITFNSIPEYHEYE